MMTTIDKAGRVVVPKAMRAALGLVDGGAVEVDLDDGRIVISPAPVPKRIVTRNGRPVVVADGRMPPLTTEMVREVLESIRR